MIIYWFAGLIVLATSLYLYDMHVISGSIAKLRKDHEALKKEFIGVLFIYRQHSARLDGIDSLLKNRKAGDFLNFEIKELK